MPRASDRKMKILQQLAEMLEDPSFRKITTASLAARLEVSEAALYRHFASKAQMFEGLIEFIEKTIFGLVNKITSDETDGRDQIVSIVNVLLNFSKKNKGMTRTNVCKKGLIDYTIVSRHRSSSAYDLLLTRERFDPL
jgi:TetR/AcrR family transcriptional regulator